MGETAGVNGGGAVPPHLHAVHQRIVRFMVSRRVTHRVSRTIDQFLGPDLRCLGWSGSDVWLGGCLLCLFRHHDAWHGRVRLLVYGCRLAPYVPRELPMPSQSAAFPLDLLAGFRTFDNRPLFRCRESLGLVDLARVGYHCHTLRETGLCPAAPSVSSLGHRIVIGRPVGEEE